MKKIIAVVTLLLAFSINASAQEKKVSVEQAAKSDIIALTSKVTISESLQKDLLTLMTMKHEATANTSLTKEQKASALKAYEQKLMGAFTPEQRNQLLKYPDLVKQLTH